MIIGPTVVNDSGRAPYASSNRRQEASSATFREHMPLPETTHAPCQPSPLLLNREMRTFVGGRACQGWSPPAASARDRRRCRA
jgi:hypothetical protein